MPFCRLNNFFIRGIQPPVSNISRTVPVKDAYPAEPSRYFPQLLPVHPADIDAVHRDRAALYIIKRLIRFVIVVFPAPVEPTKAIFCPGFA